MTRAGAGVLWLEGQLPQELAQSPGQSMSTRLTRELILLQNIRQGKAHANEPRATVSLCAMQFLKLSENLRNDGFHREAMP